MTCRPHRCVCYVDVVSAPLPKGRGILVLVGDCGVRMVKRADQTGFGYTGQREIESGEMMDFSCGFLLDMAHFCLHNP